MKRMLLVSALFLGTAGCAAQAVDVRTPTSAEGERMDAIFMEYGVKRPNLHHLSSEQAVMACLLIGQYVYVMNQSLIEYCPTLEAAIGRIIMRVTTGEDNG